jgi:hypothetical protein
MQATNSQLVPIKIKPLYELIGRDVSEWAVRAGPVYKNDGAVGADQFFNLV